MPDVIVVRWNYWVGGRCVKTPPYTTSLTLSIGLSRILRWCKLDMVTLRCILGRVRSRSILFDYSLHWCLTEKCRAPCWSVQGAFYFTLFSTSYDKLLVLEILFVWVVGNIMLWIDTYQNKQRLHIVKRNGTYRHYVLVTCGVERAMICFPCLFCKYPSKRYAITFS